jgi:hypothetical protein
VVAKDAMYRQVKTMRQVPLRDGQRLTFSEGIVRDLRGFASRRSSGADNGDEELAHATSQQPHRATSYAGRTSIMYRTKRSC